MFTFLSNVVVGILRRFVVNSRLAGTNSHWQSVRRLFVIRLISQAFLTKKSIFDYRENYTELRQLKLQFSHQFKLHSGGETREAEKLAAPPRRRVFAFRAIHRLIKKSTSTHPSKHLWRYLTLCDDQHFGDLFVKHWDRVHQLLAEAKT